MIVHIVRKLFETRCPWLFEGFSGVYYFPVDTFVLKLSDLHLNVLGVSEVGPDRYA